MDVKINNFPDTYMDVPDSFKNTLADCGIDVRGKNILEIGSGNGRQAIWLAMLGATVTGIDPAYQDIANAEQIRRHLEPQECAERITLLPHTIENHVQRGRRYPVVTAFQAYPHGWESYIDGISRATQNDGVALIMMDKFVFDRMPEGILQQYFKDVRLERCGGGDTTDMDAMDAFFLMDVNRYAFVCRGPERKTEIARASRAQ